LQTAASVQGKTRFCAGVFSSREIQPVKLLLEHKVGLPFTNVGSVSCSTIIFSGNMRAGYINQSKNGYIQNFGKLYSTLNESCVTEILVHERLKQEFQTQLYI